MYVNNQLGASPVMRAASTAQKLGLPASLVTQGAFSPPRPVFQILQTYRSPGTIPPAPMTLSRKTPLGFTSGVSYPQAPAGSMSRFPAGSGTYAKNAASERMITNSPIPSLLVRPNIAPAKLPSGANANTIPKIMSTEILGESLQKNYSGATDPHTPTLSIVPQPPIVDVVGNSAGGVSILADRSTLPSSEPSAAALPIVFEPPVVNVGADSAGVVSAGVSPWVIAALIGAAFFMLKGKKR